MKLVFSFRFNPADIAVFAAINHADVVVGAVSEHDGGFVDQIHIHNGFADGADRDVGVGFGNRQGRVDVNVQFVFGFMQGEDGFVGEFGQAELAFVVVELVFVATQTGGNVRIGIVKSRIRIAGDAGTFENDVFSRMNCYFSVKIFAFLGKSDGAADGSIKIFVNRVFDGFFNMFAKSVADVDLFACLLYTSDAADD